MFIRWGDFPDSSVGKESTCNAGDSGYIPRSGRSPGEGIGYPLQYSWASLVGQEVKNPPAMLKTWVWSLGLGRSPRGGHGNPLQYCCRENLHGQRRLAGYSPWSHRVRWKLSGMHIYWPCTMFHTLFWAPEKERWAKKTKFSIFMELHSTVVDLQ